MPRPYVIDVDVSSILAIDQGTTGTTALVVHQDGHVLGRAYREFKQYFPRPGWVEHDAEEIFRVTVEAAREAITEAGEQPVGLGITNQRETVLIWERKRLTPVGRAIVWQDRRTAGRCRALQDSGQEALIRERTGLLLDPYFSATKLEWLLQDRGIRRRAERGEIAAGTIDSWLIAKLTGSRRHATDHTNASRTMLYSLAARDWDDELLTLFEVPRSILPEIVPSSGVVAETEPGPFGVSLPIAGVAGDQQAALFGQGCWQVGLAKNTYGTGAFLLAYTGDRRATPERGVLATAACGPRGEPKYALEGSVFVAGAAVQWLRDGLGIISRADDTEVMAWGVSDTGGVSFVPAFVGLGTPHWEPDARGTITGLNRGTTRAHLARAALEAIAFSSADLVEALTGDAGIGLAALRVDGGAVANNWLMQFQADILGVPVERPDVIETTALGAAGLAGLALGVWRTGDEFIAGRRFSRFEPRIPTAERDSRVKEWHRAVGAALHWARDRSGKR